MSANERFGCLGNWTRLGFDQANVYDEPDTWVSTVINNRADRVARSKVFAAIIVNDLSADRHFLIGTNLKGLAGFISSELEKTLVTKSLGENGTYNAESAAQKLLETAHWYRQPTQPEHVATQLEAMQRAASQEAGESEIEESVEQRHQQLLAGLSEYQELDQAIRSAAGDSAWQTLDDRYRALIRTWFNRKLVVISDAAATGEQVIDQIVRATPPGIKNRVMGMQNIKGTGLDFVYRFQDWDSCHAACEMLQHADTVTARKGLDALERLPVLGQLCESHTRNALRVASERAAFQSPEMRAALDEIGVKLAASTKAIRETCQGNVDDLPTKAGTRPIDRLIHWWEEFLDVNDAIRRRTQADTIYADLANERISRQRAILEIRKINKRQKGGWLKASLDRRKQVRKDAPAVQGVSASKTPRSTSPLRELWRHVTSSRSPT